MAVLGNEVDGSEKQGLRCWSMGGTSWTALGSVFAVLDNEVDGSDKPGLRCVIEVSDWVKWLG